jgi:hypothetical protein
MTKHAIPDDVLKAHIAVLGMTGSGKTSTEKLIIEQAVAEGARVCVLDTLKSDWWGITSSASGKSAGLPFRILGGPRGHVPLHSSAGKVIGQLVGSGKLPLSIIDMADFEAGGIQRFFVDFAQSLWRHCRGVVYLVIEEAHELAPKERAGFGAENMAIHWAKKLGTGSRTKGIRLIVATQRVQALHNAVLGSCQTVIAHQLMFDADKEPVIKWVRGINKAAADQVADTLASLPAGTGWLCSGRAQIFEKVHFPKFKTFDNTATPEGDAAEIDVKTATVDQDELKSLIGDAVKEAEATDVKALQKKVAERDAKIAQLERAQASAAPVVDQAAIAAAEKRGFDRGVKETAAAADKRVREQRLASLENITERVGKLTEWLKVELQVAKADKAKIADQVAFAPSPVTRDTRSGSQSGNGSAPSPARAAAPPRRTPSPAASGDGSITGPEQRILNSLATWEQLGNNAPTNAQVAWLANYSPTSTSYTNPRGALKSKGLILYPAGDCVALTDEGSAVAVAMTFSGSVLDMVLAQLPGPERRILAAVAAEYPSEVSNEVAAERAQYSATSTSFTNPRGWLKSKELITYPSGGMVRAAEWLFAA